MPLHRAIKAQGIENFKFEVINLDDKTITIKNDRLQVVITHKDFTHFDLSYCITTHVSQGSTYDFPYSIYEYQYFDQYLIYTAMSRSTQNHILILLIINLKY